MLGEGKVNILVLIKRGEKEVKKDNLYWASVTEDGMRCSELPAGFKVYYLLFTFYSTFCKVYLLILFQYSQTPNMKLA